MRTAGPPTQFAKGLLIRFVFLCGLCPMMACADSETGNDSPPLTVDAVRAWRFGADAAPFAAAALGTDVIAIVTPDRRSVIVFRGERQDTFGGFGTGDISAIAAGTDAFWIAAKREISRLNPRTGNSTEFVLPEGSGEVRSLAVTSNMVWAVARLEGRSKLYQISKAPLCQLPVRRV